MGLGRLGETAMKAEALWIAKRSGQFGNPSCVLCRSLHVLPFARCAYCSLPGIGKCSSVKAGVAVMVGILLTGAATAWVGGHVAKMVSLAISLVSIALLLLISSYSNQRALLSRLQKELAEQQAFIQELSPLDSVQQCLDYIVNSAASRLRCRRVSIMLPDERAEYLYIAAACGVPEEVVRIAQIPVGDRVCGKVFRESRPVHVRDVTKDHDVPALPTEAKAFMSVPLMLSGMRWGNVQVGVLSVTEPVGRADFSLDDEFALSNICHVGAVAIHNQMSIAKVKLAHVELLETLAKALEARDEYTCGHSERVCEFSVAIGQKLNLDENTLNDLRTAARLHDLGKIGIPDAILQKPGKLTDEERRLVRQHPAIATHMLSETSMVGQAVIRAIESHHERLDGVGYPDGKRGQDIPLISRIISVADFFDALTSTRPYRGPLSVSDTLEELERGRGKQFDSRCVDALLEIVGSGGLSARAPLPKTAEAHIG